MLNKGSLVKMLAELVLLAASIAVVGCGSENTAPYKSTITVNPASTTTNGPSLACSGVWKDSLFKITVLDPQGNPMNDTAITITLDWAPNYAHPTTWAMQLYDVDSGGGSPVTVPYQTKTGDFGIKSVIVRHYISCDYKGQMEVFSGSAYIKADIEVN